MKRILILSALALLLLPIPTGQQVGAYNTLSGMWFCTDARTCLHERAHWLDYHNDRISDTDEFRRAATVYIFTRRAYGLIGLTMGEVYAELYAQSNGQPPTPLDAFYPPLPGPVVSIDIFGGSLYALHDPGH